MARLKRGEVLGTYIQGNLGIAMVQVGRRIVAHVHLLSEHIHERKPRE